MSYRIIVEFAQEHGQAAFTPTSFQLSYFDQTVIPSGGTIEATRGHQVLPDVARYKSEGCARQIELMEIQFVVWPMIRVTKPLVVRVY
jgi:hypothetical protein